jgi:hypothetical protein
MVILDLSVFEGELPSRALAREVMAIGMFVPPSIGTCIRHLVIKVSVVAGHAAPPGGSGRTEMVGGLTVRGEMIEPRAVGAATTLFVLFLCQGIILGVVAGPRDCAPRPPSQMQSPMFVIGARLPVVGSVSPCQFPSFTIFIY